MKGHHVVVWMERPTIDDDHLSALRLVRWLAQDPSIIVEVVTAHEGPLLGAFTENAEVLVLDDLNRWRVGRTLALLGCSRAAQVAKGLKLRWWLARRRRAGGSVVIGSAAAWVTTLPFGPRRPVILSECPSALVDLDTATRARIESVMSHEAHEATDLTVATPALFERPNVVGSWRRELDAPDDLSLVGAVGPSTWWTTPEQFVLWTWAFRRRYPNVPVRFCWLTNASESEVWTLRHDLTIAGLDDVVVVNRPDFLDCVPLLDVLVLSGRRPSWSHLVRAARQRGVDVVATDDVLDAEDDSGVRVVPYLDLDAMVEAIVAALRTPAPATGGPGPPVPALELLRALRS